MGQGHANHKAPLTIATPGQPCKKHAILSSHHTAYFIGFTSDSIACAGHDELSCYIIGSRNRGPWPL